MTSRLGARLRLAFLLPVLIIGGLKFGIFIPTEAAVVAPAFSLSRDGFA